MKLKGLIIGLLLTVPLLLGTTGRIEVPTRMVNGDVLLPAQISRSNILCSLAGGTPVNKATMQGADTTATWTETVAGTYTCFATTTDTEGRTSAPSATVNFTVGRCEVSDCRPMPPTIVTITLN